MMNDRSRSGNPFLPIPAEPTWKSLKGNRLRSCFEEWTEILVMSHRPDRDDVSKDVSTRRISRGRFTIALAVVIGSVVVAIWGIARLLEDRPSSPAAGVSTDPVPTLAQRYVGDRVCAECHDLEANAYERSGHASTLRSAAKVGKLRALRGATVADPADPAVSWSFRFRNGALTIDRKAEGKSKTLKVSDVFGSGRHGLTLVTLDPQSTAREPNGVEHRLTLYTHSGTWNVSPGHDFRGVESDPKADPAKNPAAWGRVLDVEETRRCYGCHSTLLSRDDPSRLDPATIVRNVGCERCHGPGLEHVRAARRGDKNLAMAMGPGRSEPELEIRACGQCHRVPLADSKIANENDAARVIRFQPIGLMLSRCFVKSGGAISCTTCHDPHDDAVAAGDVAERVCYDCHRASPQVVCPVSPKSACVSCHMPTRLANDGMSFVDHWIHVRKTSAKGSSTAKDRADSSQASSRKESAP